MSERQFGHAIFGEIPDRILELAKCSLAQANQHATFSDSGVEYWPIISILNATHAGELFIKAAIARVHPLLIFQNPFEFSSTENDELRLETLVKNGKSHDFAKLPKIYWACTGNRIESEEVFRKAQSVRNSVQHFLVPEDVDIGDLSMRFLYEVVDPLIHREFGLHAIDHFERTEESYDYTVGVLLRSGIRFKVPPNFDVSEIYVGEELQNAESQYIDWFKAELTRINRFDLFERSWMKDQKRPR